MTWDLADPGMDLLERAGLAALYMTLRAASEREVDLSPLGWQEMDLTSHSVTVRWEGPPKAAFARLFEWAWQVRDGVLFLPAVHRMQIDCENVFRRIPVHSGILRTFLQHPRVQPKGELVMRSDEIEEGKQLVTRYISLEGKTLKPVQDLPQLFDRQGGFKNARISLSSWLLPGMAPRFTACEAAWEGSPAAAVLLMLAPVVCLYQRLPAQHTRKKGSGARAAPARKGRSESWSDNWAVVIPDVRDLEEFDGARPYLSPDPRFVDVASLGDAALRFAADYASRPIRRETEVGCRIIAMGKVSFYNPGQSVRKGVLDTAPTPQAVRRYQHLHRVLPNRYVPLRQPRDSPVVADTESQDPQATPQTDSAQGPTGFILVPSGRGRMADNLIAGQPWYRDLGAPMVWDLDRLDSQRRRLLERDPYKGRGISLERLWFQNLSYQKEELMELIQEEEMWDSEDERVFVQAFWETLASLYAQEAEAVKHGGSRKVDERLEDLNKDIYRRLMTAKTRDLVRSTLAELLAKAGRQQTIRHHPAVLWNLLDHPQDWKRARDLALLALASYARREKPESTSAQPATTQ